MRILLPNCFRDRRPSMLDAMGPLVDLPPGPDGGDYAVIPGIVPGHVTVPLHSHPERETMVVVAGRVDAWLAVYNVLEVL